MATKGKIKRRLLWLGYFFPVLHPALPFCKADQVLSCRIIVARQVASTVDVYRVFNRFLQAQRDMVLAAELSP